jgi:hypothetical protein
MLQIKFSITDFTRCLNELSVDLNKAINHIAVDMFRDLKSISDSVTSLKKHAWELRTLVQSSSNQIVQRVDKLGSDVKLISSDLEKANLFKSELNSIKYDSSNIDESEVVVDEVPVVVVTKKSRGRTKKEI